MATNAVTAYALGVVIGSPVITIVAARLNRRTLLLGLVGLFVVGNLLSALAPDFGTAGRRPLRHRQRAGRVLRRRGGRGRLRVRPGPGWQGVRHGDGGTHGRHHRRIATGHIHRPARWLAGPVLDGVAIGLRPGARSGLAAPDRRTCTAARSRNELGALRRPMVWVTIAVAALGISSIFAVYTFIGPFVTDAAGRDARSSRSPSRSSASAWRSATGSAARLADRYEYRGLVWATPACWASWS